MSEQENIEYEKRLRYRLWILKEYLKDWKISVSKEIWDWLFKSLERVSYDENGEIELNTVDWMVRSMALAIEFMDYRDKIKSCISLKEIQETYFWMIENNFNIFYTLMIDKKSDPHQIASFIAYNTKDIDYIDNIIDKLISDITEFWTSVNEAWYMHLEDDNESIKAVFWWDLFPWHSENIASKCWIYTDTIVLPCPFIRTRDVFGRVNKQKRVYYLIKHALNILQYKELALADTKKPIIVVLADKQMLDKTEFDIINQQWMKDALIHTNRIFGRNFQDMQEAINFWTSLDTIEKLMKEIKDPKRVLFDTEFTDPLDVQIKNQLKSSFEMTQIKNPGLLVAISWLWRMGVSNELLMKSSQIRWTPIIDAPTSWEYFKWKLEYDAESIYWKQDFEKMHIVKGLEWLNHTNLEWIWKIPPKWLIELRQTWAIDEIRSILGSNINELVQANPLDFNVTSNKVFQNIDEAVKKHQERINELRSKKWKIAGQDFWGFIVYWTIELAAICTQNPLIWAVWYLIDQWFNPKKIKDIPETIQKIKQTSTEKEELKRSPLGMIFKYKP